MMPLHSRHDRYSSVTARGRPRLEAAAAAGLPGPRLPVPGNRGRRARDHDADLNLASRRPGPASASLPPAAGHSIRASADSAIMMSRRLRPAAAEPASLAHRLAAHF